MATRYIVDRIERRESLIHAGEHGVARMDLTTAKVNVPAQWSYMTPGSRRSEVFYAYSKARRNLTSR